MNTSKLLKLVLIVFLRVAVVAVAEETNSISLTSDDTDAIHGVQFFLMFPKTTFTNGEPIVAWGVLTNLTGSPMNVPTPNVGIGLEWAVTNVNNLRVAQIDDGHGRHITGTFGDSLPPHGCISNLVTIHRLYNLKPGVYRICAKREMSLHPPWGKNVLTSSVMMITIVESSKKY